MVFATTATVVDWTFCRKCTGSLLGLHKSNGFISAPSFSADATLRHSHNPAGRAQECAETHENMPILYTCLLYKEMSYLCGMSGVSSVKRYISFTPNAFCMCTITTQGRITLSISGILQGPELGIR